MISVWSASVFALTLPVMAGAQTELGRTTLLGEDVILYDDNTWTFVNPAAGTPMALTGDACFETGEGRLVFCPPDLWPERAAVFSDFGTEVFLSGGDTGHLLTVYLDESYGHGGAYDLYEDVGPVGEFFLTTLTRALGLANFEEFSLIQDEVVFLSFTSVDGLSGHTSVSLQIMTEAQSLWVDLETEFLIDGTEVRASEHDPNLVRAVLETIFIDDTPLPEWLEAAEGKQ